MTYRLPALNGLKAFEASARNLSFKTAATELGVTPGAVSQLVRKLEGSLAVDLFKRLPNGLLLTPEGETYYPKIAHVFELLTEATEDIAPNINSRKFRVGMHPDIIKHMPSGWVRRSEAMRNAVQDVVPTKDVAMIWDRDIDCFLGFDTGPHAQLKRREVVLAAQTTLSRDIVYESMDGLINCRQSDQIISFVRHTLSSRSV